MQKNRILSTITTGFLLLAMLLPGIASASQFVKVLLDQVGVHALPDATSPQIAILSKGATVPASSGMVKDGEGTYWYKVKLPNAEGFGYVVSGEVEASALDSGLLTAGVGKIEIPVEDHNLTWSLVLRGMGLLGMQTMSPLGLSYGGELEISTCLPLTEEGYFHRMLAVGGAVMALNQDVIIAGSAIFRFFEKTRAETEVRIRFGQGFTTGTWMGINVGLDYPFTLNKTVYFAGYLEAGSLASFSGNGALLWGAAGVGYHFY